MGVRILFVLMVGGVFQVVHPLGGLFGLGGTNLLLLIPIDVDYQLGDGGVGDCMMHGSARASSMPSAKR